MASSAASSSSSSSSRNPPATPTSIGPFHIGTEIGKGSFAVVHKGLHLPEGHAHSAAQHRSSSSATSPKEVAIKIVTRRKLTQKLLDNLEGEIAILKAVSHPNIVELIDCLKTDAQIYLVMDFSSGGDLSQYIKRKGILADDAITKPSSRAFLTAAKAYPHPADGGLNARVVRSFLEQLAAAMEFMRVRNIVHRDIKPQNLLLQPPTSACLAQGHPAGIPQLKVADFGFARSLPAASLAETLCGSPLYMAPEILRYEKYDAKADLWSIGAVTFEMTVGKPPFRAANHVELLRRIERNEDKIKFPDERSEGTWLKEVQRRRDADEYVSLEEEKRGPTKVEDDIKLLIRALLKRRPVERMSFEDFFSSPVILEARPAEGVRTQPQSPRTHEILSATSSTSVTSSSSATEGVPSRPTPGPMLPLQPSPSTRIQAPPPLAQAPLPKFKSKYIVAQKSDASSAVSQNEATVSTLRPRKPAGEEQKTLARQKSSGESSIRSTGTPLSSATPSRVPSLSKLSAHSMRKSEGEGSTTRTPSIGGSNQVSASQEEDEFQYVMIEKKNVEVNALADELAFSPGQARSPLAIGAANAAAMLVRRPSRLTKLASGYAPSVPSTATNAGSPTTEAVIPLIRPGLTPTATASPVTTSSAPSAPFALPPGTRRQSFASRRTSGGAFNSTRPAIDRTSSYSSQHKRDEIHEEKVEAATAQPTATLPPSGVEGAIGASLPRYPGVSISPGSALARAISQASQKLFGMPSGTVLLGGGLSFKGATALIRGGRVGGAQAGAVNHVGLQGEASLLLHLDDCAQKAFVLCEFADSRLSSAFAEGPHQPAWVSSSSSSSLHHVVDSIDRQRSLSLSASSTQATSGTGGGYPAEVLANEALLIYVKSMSFLQRGIEVVRSYLEMRGADSGVSMSSSPTISAELNEAVQSLRRRFNETFDRADFARSKCAYDSTSSSSSPESMPPALSVNKLIYDKALEIGKAAALDELENNHANASIGSTPTSAGVNTASPPMAIGGDGQWNIHACLLAYETAAVMLSCLLSSNGEGVGPGNAEMEGLSVEPFFKSINHRSEALRRRLEVKTQQPSVPASASAPAEV